MDRPAKKKKTSNAKSATVTAAVSVTKVMATVAPAITAPSTAPAAPMSAIAARRNAMMLAAQAAASLATIPEPLDKGEDDDDDNGDKASLASGDEVDADNDEDDEGAQNSDDSDRGGDSDDDDDNKSRTGSRSSSRNASASRQERRDRKVFMDPQSVSSWQPSRYNIVYSSGNHPELIVIGMKSGESIVFQGAAYVTPILGDAAIMGHVISGKSSKGNSRKRAGGDQPAQLDLSSLQSYPVFSPRTHALTTIDSIRLSQTERKKLMYLGKAEMPSSLTTTSSSLPLGSLRALVEPLLSELNIQDFDTVLVLQSAVHTGLFGIEKVVPLFKGILSRGKRRVLHHLNTRDLTEEQQLQQKLIHALEGFHPILEPTEGIAALRIPETWQSAIQALVDSTWTTEHGDKPTPIKQPPVAVVCGGKKMGKSTFSRLLLNRMLNRYKRVAFLECDVGQSEFSPVGMVALHVIDRPALGPPFTHFRAPYRAFFIGHSTPRDDPDYYMACIQELFRTYTQELSHTRHWDEDDDYHSDTENGDDDHIPLIVNTQGWIRGMGLDLLLQLLDAIQPSHVFGFHSSSTPESNLPPPFFDCLKAQAGQVGKVHPPIFNFVGAVVLGDDNNLSPFTKFHPADHRTLALVSYFYAKHPQNLQHSSTVEQEQDESLPIASEVIEAQEDGQWDFTQALIVRKPWCWDWRQAKGVWVLFDQVPPSQILHALNANLVALIGDKKNSNGEEDGEEGAISEIGNVQEQPSALLSQTEANGAAGDPSEGDEPPSVSGITPPNYFPLGQYPPPPPALTTCHGLAIIRSIQPATHTLHILTPVAPATLSRCNGIVKGTIQLPVHLSLDHNDESSLVRGIAGVPWRKIPYLLYETTVSSNTTHGVLNSSVTNGFTSGGLPMQRSRSFPEDYTISQPSSPRIMGADSRTTRKNLGRKRLQ